jgi:MFS family permease
MKHAAGIKRGAILQLLRKRDTAVRFVSCIASGMPIYLTFSIFAVFSPELAPAIGIVEPIAVADVMLCVSVGLTLGDVLAGLLSQLMRQRKAPLILLIVLNCIVAVTILSGVFTSSLAFLVLIGLLGLTSGYWACLITTAAEQFGTNIRATVTTMVPNLVRATAIPMTIAFVEMRRFLSIQETVWVVAAVVFATAFWGLSQVRESFDTDLDFYEA